MLIGQEMLRKDLPELVSVVQETLEEFVYNTHRDKMKEDVSEFSI